MIVAVNAIYQGALEPAKLHQQQNSKALGKLVTWGYTSRFTLVAKGKASFLSTFKIASGEFPWIHLTVQKKFHKTVT